MSRRHELHRAILGSSRIHLARTNRRGESRAVCGIVIKGMNVDLAGAEAAAAKSAHILGDAHCMRCWG